MENVLPSSHEKFKQKTFEPLPICAISLSTLKKIWTCQTGWVQGEDHDPCPRINRGFSGPLSSLIFKGILYLKSTNQTNLNRFGSIFCCIFHKIDPPFFFIVNEYGAQHVWKHENTFIGIGYVVGTSSNRTWTRS